MSVQFQDLIALKHQPELIRERLESLSPPPLTQFQFPNQPSLYGIFYELIASLKENTLTPEKVKNPYLRQAQHFNEESKNTFSEIEVKFLRNSVALIQLFFHVDEALRGEQKISSFISETFHSLDQDLKNILAGHVYRLSKDPMKGGDGWGEKHALDDLGVLKTALLQLVEPAALIACQEKIKAFAVKQFEALSPEEKNPVYRSFYDLSGRPKTSDPQWGENHIFDDASRLIAVLHCHGKIGGALSTAEYARDWEGANFSRLYSTEGNDLQTGEISYINGTGCSFDQAKHDAQRMTREICQNFRMHPVYAASLGDRDFLSAAFSQKGVLLPQSRLLIQRWVEFFSRAKPEEKFLQICTSRGAIDVFAALRAITPEMQKRMIVLAIAPAAIITKNFCYKAMNFVISDDAVPQLALNRELIGKSPEVRILPNHHDGANSHDLHGASYRDAISPLINSYIQTNTIGV
jgi:hypothetical protein